MTDGRHAVSLISPLASAGRAEEVVQRVSQAIQLGLFVDGEQLPPEAEFAAQLGVSAMTLREALAALRQQGLVRKRLIFIMGAREWHRRALPAPEGASGEDGAV
jgi:DNA-binding FadR family transcriptional regulator